MKNTTILLLLILIQGCSKENTVSLSIDPIVNEHFNKKEIQELDGLLEFFENEMTSSTSSGDIYEKYELFFGNLQLEDNKPIISFNKQEKLIAELDPKLLNEIWYYELEYVPYLNDTVKLIRYPMKGKYFEFLFAASEKNEGIEKYFDNYSVGCLRPSLLANSMKYNITNKLNYGLNMERNRLIIAINYLIYNDYLRLEENQRNKEEFSQ